MLRAALRPGGSVFFVDNANNAQIAAKDHHLPEADSFVMDRKLNDGRRFRVVKVFYEPAALETRLRALGWRGYVRSLASSSSMAVFKLGSRLPTQGAAAATKQLVSNRSSVAFWREA